MFIQFFFLVSKAKLHIFLFLAYLQNIDNKSNGQIIDYGRITRYSFRWL